MGRGVSRLRLRPRRTGFAVAATALVGTFLLVPAAPAETVPTFSVQWLSVSTKGV